MGAITWVTLAGIGAILMFLMRFTPERVDFVLVRLAGAAFMGAGLIGMSGWIGDVADSVLGWASRATDQAAVVVIGSTVMWVIVALLALLWIGAMLPDSWFQLDPPDWLVITGLVLPSLLVVVPGGLGEFLRSVTTWAGEGMTTLVTSWVS
ncbi:MAG TPA: hypothetical protein VIP77_19390 [Jiangellaceae bacterium]